jgi:hypothetical protein
MRKPVLTRHADNKDQHIKNPENSTSRTMSRQNSNHPRESNIITIIIIIIISKSVPLKNIKA